MPRVDHGISLPGCVLVAHGDLLEGARLARACRHEGLMPLVAFTADEVLETLDRLALDAVVASARLSPAPPTSLVACLRRHTEALLILLGGEDDAQRHADIRLDAGTPARVVARHARRLLAAPPPVATHAWGSLHLDGTLRQAWWDGVPLPLTGQQFDLLDRLVRAHGGVVSVADLAEAVYGRPGWHDAERIRAHVLRLRRRLSEASPGAGAVLRTIRGVGFRLQDPQDPPSPPPARVTAREPLR